MIAEVTTAAFRFRVMQPELLGRVEKLLLMIVVDMMMPMLLITMATTTATTRVTTGITIHATGSRLN